MKRKILVGRFRRCNKDHDHLPEKIPQCYISSSVSGAKNKSVPTIDIQVHGWQYAGGYFFWPLLGHFCCQSDCHKLISMYRRRQTAFHCDPKGDMRVIPILLYLSMQMVCIGWGRKISAVTFLWYWQKKLFISPQLGEALWNGLANWF